MEHKIAKFWNRLAALVIDVMILGLLGFVLGLFFENFFISLGEDSFLIGLIISVVYFAVGNSKLPRGQTVGKRAMGIQVVDREGHFLSFEKSLFRAAALVISYFLSNYAIAGVTNYYIIIAVNFVAVVVFTGIVLIYILNNKTRQSLHDLLVKSYVTDKEKNENLQEVKPLKKAPFYIYGAVVILLLGGYISVAAYMHPVKQGRGADYSIKLGQIDGVLSAGTTDYTNTTYAKKTTTTHSFVVRLSVKKLPGSNDLSHSEIVTQAAKIVLSNEKDIDQYDLIKIVVVKGFNIGIAKKTFSYSISKSPAAWKELLKK